MLRIGARSTNTTVQMHGCRCCRLKNLNSSGRQVRQAERFRNEMVKLNSGPGPLLIGS